MSDVLDPIWKAAREKKPTDYQIILEYLSARKAEAKGRAFDLPAHAVETDIPWFALTKYRKLVMGGTISRRWREVKAEGMLRSVGLRIAREFDHPETGWRTWTLEPCAEPEVTT